MYWTITSCAYRRVSREEPLRPIDGSIPGAAYISYVRSLLVARAIHYDEATVYELMLFIDDTIKYRRKHSLNIPIEADTS
jgi:hypothetical protein